MSSASLTLEMNNETILDDAIAIMIKTGKLCAQGGPTKMLTRPANNLCVSGIDGDFVL